MPSLECCADSPETAEVLGRGIAFLLAFGNRRYTRTEQKATVRESQNVGGDLDGLNSNRILSIQSARIQNEGSLGTTALRPQAKRNENPRWRRYSQGTNVLL